MTVRGGSADEYCCCCWRCCRLMPPPPARRGVRVHFRSLVRSFVRSPMHECAQPNLSPFLPDPSPRLCVEVSMEDMMDIRRALVEPDPSKMMRVSACECSGSV
jgi:hypothetical protein